MGGDPCRVKLVCDLYCGELDDCLKVEKEIIPILKNIQNNEEAEEMKLTKKYKWYLFGGFISICIILMYIVTTLDYIKPPGMV